jgi:hypothetical protein
MGIDDEDEDEDWDHIDSAKDLDLDVASARALGLKDVNGSAMRPCVGVDLSSNIHTSLRRRAYCFKCFSVVVVTVGRISINRVAFSSVSCGHSHDDSYKVSACCYTAVTTNQYCDSHRHTCARRVYRTSKRWPKRNSTMTVHMHMSRPAEPRARIKGRARARGARPLDAEG